MMAQQAGIDIESIFPVKTVLRDLAADYNLEAQTTDNDNVQEVEDGKKALMQKLMDMKQQIGQPQIPTEPQMPQAQATMGA